jgi:tRNA threonylcarbamoyladenosine biosynthesis protein TsaE
VSVQVDLPDPEATRGYGRALARVLRRGDLVVLTGALGSGKTTLTQGIGEGLGVRGRVTSPTFIIAREHPSLGDGPTLVHVDAYRLGSLVELDALDLDASLEESVTVVEWGEDLVEVLSEDRLEIVIERSYDGLDVAALVVDAELGVRRVTVTAHGQRWEGVDISA